MAEVQLALQRGPAGFEKLVVVKLVHAEFATQKAFVDMLLDEARVAALVKHPNVVDIYDLGEADGKYFIASCLTGGLALLLALLVGVPLGTIAALRHQHMSDRLLMAIASISQALPKFVIAPLLILLFAVKLHWLPAGGWASGDGNGGGWRYLVLPVIALALPNLAYCARLMRASLIEVLQSDYLRAARSRGFGEARLLFVHAFKPALLPLIGWLSPALIAVVTGSAVVEQIFGIPGIGRYFVQGALNRDYTLVLGVVLVAGAMVIAVNVLVDGLRLWLDPRQRE